MVLSCLVEPLVSPLKGRGASGPGRSMIMRSRLATSALIASALYVAASSMPASEIVEEREQVACNAHRRPDPKPYRELFEIPVWAVAREDDRMRAPEASAEFEWDAVVAHRLTHARNIARDTGPGLGRGRRIDRTRRSPVLTYALFGSGRHRAGSPRPIA
jgi:hypothetical protein